MLPDSPLFEKEAERHEIFVRQQTGLSPMTWRFLKVPYCTKIQHQKMLLLHLEGP
jgi:hypothetical protein